MLPLEIFCALIESRSLKWLEEAAEEARCNLPPCFASASRVCFAGMCALPLEMSRVLLESRSRELLLEISQKSQVYSISLCHVIRSIVTSNETFRYVMQLKS